MQIEKRPSLKPELPENVRPFLSLHIARQKARLHRIVQKGLAPPDDHASLRAAADQAVRDRKPTIIPMGVTTNGPPPRR
jgi:hypothetical protein